MSDEYEPMSRKIIVNKAAYERRGILPQVLEYFKEQCEIPQEENGSLVVHMLDHEEAQRYLCDLQALKDNSGTILPGTDKTWCPEFQWFWTHPHYCSTCREE